jgi:hypothetical protein
LALFTWLFLLGSLQSALGFWQVSAINKTKLFIKSNPFFIFHSCLQQAGFTFHSALNPKSPTHPKPLEGASERTTHQQTCLPAAAGRSTFSTNQQHSNQKPTYYQNTTKPDPHPLSEDKKNYSTQKTFG